MKRILILAIVALWLAAPAAAQQQQAGPAAQPGAAAPRTAGVDPNAALNGALQVAGMIDAGHVGELWDGASSVTKRATQRQPFVEGITKMRKAQGAVAGRGWTAVRRQQLAGTDQVPAGNYVSVELAAQVAGNKLLRELVTFRVDEDGVMRFSGYVME
ncbi:DUF4019 domain-containing protein [Pseudoxanthomonas putridarboris]|uniref:DUF4019 domain-containing protein n=1 Tax=Pseudoxanthomonas putridarboris TaxID=752605 RepID=A0ABU9J3R4_9GAMM